MTLPETANQKIFTIVMATYNSGRKVEDTLNSILSQNKNLFELIVFDGASTDDTLDYLKKYAGDLTLRSETDAGVYDAFNKAIDLAAGEYIYFIGAGDCLRPNVLERVAEHLPSDNPTLVYGNCYFAKQKIFDGREFSSRDFILSNICHQGEFYHRSVFDILGKYDLRYKIFADWHLNLKCFVNERINKKYIPLYIADYEEGGLSSSINNDPAFRRDFPGFIKKELGLKAFLISRTLMINPDVFYFFYVYGLAAGNKLLWILGSVARSFVRGFKNLRKKSVKAK